MKEIKLDIDKIIVQIRIFEDKLNIADNAYYQLNQEYKDELSKFPFNEILEKNGIVSPKKIEDIKNSVISLYTENNHQKFDSIINEFNQYPEYKKSTEILHKRDIAKINYLVALYNYISYIDFARKLLFSENYIKNMDYLADLGYLLYHYHIPDNVLENTPQNDLENYIVETYSKNDYEILNYSFQIIFQITKFDNELQKKKINDLKEAFACLKNGLYNSCTRTMFSLIDNEYCVASELSNQSKNYKRTEQISEFIEKLGNKYYSHAWEKIKKFYEKCTVNTDEQDKSEINRHDLMHGVYNKESTKEDCIRLFLLYQNLKDIRYILNNINLLSREFEMDFAVRKAIMEVVK